MPAQSVDVVIAQIDDVLKVVRPAETAARQQQSVPDNEVAIAVTSVNACIRRLTPRGSAYQESANKIVGVYPIPNWTMILPLAGVLSALREDYRANRMRSMEELIHADLFSDFIEMARHLAEEGYKDASAVIIGSTLEGHLRQLCTSHKIATDDSDGRPHKADRLNAELGKVAYGKQDQKQVTAWLDLRNDAAHGHYAKYATGQVALMIDGVSDFMRRLPA